MEPSIDDLRSNYKHFSDEELIHIATSDASGMRPEAIQVMQEEIKSRGLSTDLLKGIEVQRKDISESELLAYCELVRNQPCPICGSTSTKLNATIAATVVSYIIMTSKDRKLIVACPDCLDRANKAATRKTALFGWWGFPHGIFSSIKAILHNRKMSDEIQLAEPNGPLIGFVLGRIGAIESNKSNPEQLRSLIRQINAQG